HLSRMRGGHSPPPNRSTTEVGRRHGDPVLARGNARRGKIVPAAMAECTLGRWKKMQNIAPRRGGQEGSTRNPGGTEQPKGRRLGKSAGKGRGAEPAEGAGAGLEGPTRGERAAGQTRATRLESYINDAGWACRWMGFWNGIGMCGNVNFLFAMESVVCSD